MPFTGKHDSFPVMHLLIVPLAPAEQIARSLVASLPDAPDVVARILPVEEANAVAIQLYDGDGQALNLDYEAFAARLSVGSHGVGLLTDGEHWRAYAAGALTRQLGPDDALFLPVDEDGLPDMEQRPVRRGDGVPAGWGLFRSAADLGMTSLVSCRFGPVRHALSRPGRRFVLVHHGRALHPPAELGDEDVSKR